jgi:cation:H+ antiporter
VLVAEFLVLAGVIAAAGTVLTRSADAIAERTGLGRLLVGSVLLAGATSLPELTVDMNAVWIGAADLAVGDLMGSSLFNLLILALLDLLQPGSLLAVASPVHVISALATVIVTGVAVMGQLYQVEKRRLLLEPDALLVILLIVGSLALPYFGG